MPPKASKPTSNAISSHRKSASRDLRSTSPVKNPIASPTKAKPTPRKPRAKKDKTNKEAKTTEPIADSADESSDEIDAIIEAAGEDAAVAAVADAVAAIEPEPLADGSVRVSVTEDVVPGEDDTETTRTTVKVELPADSPDLKLPKDTEGVVAVARDIVESAKDLQQDTAENAPASKSAKPSRKRKASMSVDEKEAGSPEEIVQEIAEADATELTTANGEVQLRPTKRTRVMVAAEEYRREKVKRRALMGLSGALAVG